MSTTRHPVLAIRDLRVEYPIRLSLFRHASPIRVLDHLNLDVQSQETVGLVGESGSGKSTVINSIVRLVEAAAGEIRIAGDDILRANGRDLRRLRRSVQVIFQNPYSSLDPHLTVVRLVGEPLRVHHALEKREERTRVAELLAEVGLSKDFLGRFPHELSGGQAQRVALARALALRPKLLLLDEPTSSLDVSVQAQVLNLLLELQGKFGLSYLFVSHDLDVVQHISDRIAVMYLGEVVEQGRTETIFHSPSHPYTQGLLAASGHGRQDRPAMIKGNVPRFSNPPSGCRFHTRCPHTMDICRTEAPGTTNVSGDAWARCHLLTSAARTAEPVDHSSR